MGRLGLGETEMTRGLEGMENSDDNSTPGGTTKHTDVCKRFLLRDCPNGPNGDRLVNGKTCSKDHPARCRRFCQYGTTSRIGCSMGSQCSYFHPTLCHDYEISRLCTNRDCKDTHLKYTRRSEDATSKRSSPKGQGGKPIDPSQTAKKTEAPAKKLPVKRVLELNDIPQPALMTTGPRRIFSWS